MYALRPLFFAAEGILIVIVGFRTMRHPNHLVSSVAFLTSMAFVFATLRCLGYLLYRAGGFRIDASDLPGFFLEFPIFAGGLMATTLLCVMKRKVHFDPTCCQCKYVLRGLSEPRCPECGRVYTLDEFYRL